MSEATERRQRFELVELKRCEELKLAIWLVKHRTDMFSDNPPEAETYLNFDDAGMTVQLNLALEAACRLLVVAKERHREAWVNYQHAWSAEHDEREAAEFKRRQTAAHAAVSAAVASGQLARPTTCDGCGNSHDRIIAHHDSYDEDKQLDVRWLCPPCHGKHHAEHGSAK